MDAEHIEGFDEHSYTPEIFEVSKKVVGMFPNKDQSEHSYELERISGVHLSKVVGLGGLISSAAIALIGVPAIYMLFVPVAAIPLGMFVAVLMFVSMTYWAGYSYDFVYYNHSYREKCIRRVREKALEIPEIALQIYPENYSLEEAVTLIKNTAHDYWKYFSDVKVFEELYSEEIEPALKELYETLLRYPAVRSYIYIDRAITRELIENYNDIYNEGTGKFIKDMEVTLNYGPSQNFTNNTQSHRKFMDVLCSHYASEHEEEIEQLRYNMEHLYPILRERKQSKESAEKEAKEEKLRENFEKWFSETLLPDAGDISEDI